MPELPEVETVARGLARAMEGQAIRKVTLARPDLRFPFPFGFADRLSGRLVSAVRRRAKYVLADLDDGSLLAMHLGMTGSFRVEAAGEGGAMTSGNPIPVPNGRHDHVRFDLASGTSITYNDPRRFGYMTLVEPGGAATHPLFRAMGIEPLDDAFDGVVLAGMLRGRSTPLKTALLDQRLIAGLGNIYVCEALHRAGLSPMREAGTLVGSGGKPKAKATALAREIRAVLLEAIESGGSTLQDYRHTDGSKGGFQERFRAYDREGEECATAKCRGVIRRAVQNGRSTFYCAECQR